MDLRQNCKIHKTLTRTSKYHLSCRTARVVLVPRENLIPNQERDHQGSGLPSHTYCDGGWLLFSSKSFSVPPQRRNRYAQALQPTNACNVAAAATTMHVRETGRGAERPIILQGATAAPAVGHIRLPDQFYQGLHFGLSAWNEWGEKVSSETACSGYTLDYGVWGQDGSKKWRSWSKFRCLSCFAGLMSVALLLGLSSQ